jgi:predicted nucleotide-binding protein
MVEVRCRKNARSYPQSKRNLPPERQSIAEMSRDIFIVHGHDAAAKNEVAHVINRAGLNAVVLHEQPNGGRKIIEKLKRTA